MVDSIKGPNGSSPSSQSKVNEKKLRDNFKTLSSELKIADAASVRISQQPEVSGVRSKELNKLLNNLNEAVKYSNQAFNLLGSVESSESTDAKERVVIKQVADELDKVRNDIEQVVGALKRKAETVEIYSENLNSSSARIKDLEMARAHAKEARASIAFAKEEAVEAHANLDSERIAKLLAD